MNETWNLDALYRGFSDPAYDADFQELTESVAAFGALGKKLRGMEPAQGLHEGIALLERITTLANKLAEYASLRQAGDTRDTEAGSQLGRIMAVYSGTAAPQAAFESWAAELPELDTLVESSEILREYRFLFEKVRRSSRYLLGGEAESVLARFRLSGSDAWSELQQYLTSTVSVLYRGETTNLSAVRNLAYSADAAVRKDAYEAELSCYPRIRDSVAYALNSIKLETLSECRLRGYDSPLDMTLRQSQMQRATLDAMFAAIDEYLPRFWQYLRAKAKALGYENGLPWYELFAPMGRSSTRFTAEQARDYLVNLFTSFNPEEGDMIATAFDNAWIDFYPRDGKAGGAFCADIESLCESRILTNFSGTLGDVVTLAHELGHAYHNHCLHTQRPLNHETSMPLAETASTFNECVTMAYAIAHAADEQERLALLESQLQDITQVICDIYSRYRFETAVFAERGDRFLSADDLCARMLEAQKYGYGDGLDEKYLHPYMWVCKSHYYGPIFYNFPYAFGALFARGLYAQYEREGAAFLPKYRRLLCTTAVATAEDTAAVAGIDLTDADFWRGALEIVSQQIDEFCAAVDGGVQ